MTRYVKGVSVYKPARRKRKADPYLIAYKDPTSRKRRVVTGSTSLPVTVEQATKLAARLERIRLGLSSHKEDGYQRAETKLITDHVVDFKKWLAASGDTGKHVRETVRLCERIFELAGITRVSEITEGTARAGISAFREMGRSLKRCNHAVRSVKTFSKWLRKEGRAAEHTLADLASYNAKTDVRHARRALNDDEIERLLTATESGIKKAGLSGADRAMLYRVALGTGFRLGELRSLSPASFALQGNPPTVTVQATASKRRRTDVQPIRKDLADLLRPWLAARPADEPAFSMLPHAHASVMVRWDLKKAGIPYVDESGKFADFHSLRHTYITRLVRSGISLKVAQDLARHSTPVLTAGYSHMQVSDHVAALDALPPIGAKKPRKDNREVG